MINSIQLLHQFLPIKTHSLLAIQQKQKTILPRPSPIQPQLQGNHQTTVSSLSTSFITGNNHIISLQPLSCLTVASGSAQPLPITQQQQQQEKKEENNIQSHCAIPIRLAQEIQKTQFSFKPKHSLLSSTTTTTLVPLKSFEATTPTTTATSSLPEATIINDNRENQKQSFDLQKQPLILSING